MLKRAPISAALTASASHTKALPARWVASHGARIPHLEALPCWFCN